MTTKQKKLFMLIVGFLAHTVVCIIKTLHIADNRILSLGLTLIQYGSMLMFIFGVNYFGTTYQYEKYPEESLQTIIDQNDERTCSIHNRAKAKSFDIITYVLILLPLLLLEVGTNLAGVILSGIVLIILGISYLHYLKKYSKEM